VIIFSNNISNRLRYITDILGREIKEPVQFTKDPQIFNAANGPRINYGDKALQQSFWIKPSGLLFESTINPQPISCFTYKENKAFFQTDGDFPFDIFSASFYLLSRYEECLPHQQDKYGRFDHRQSLAFKEGFLHLPLVNIWIGELRKDLMNKFPEWEPANSSELKLKATYDIDEAFAYKYKTGLWNIGGKIRDVLKGDKEKIRTRRDVRNGLMRDPYDSFDEIDSINKDYKLDPIYFFLVSANRSKYDKNIFLNIPAMRELVRRHADQYKIGMHPSWQSHMNAETIRSELERLQDSSGKSINSSRQHYIRFKLPETFRLLIDLGIREEFSMGYGSINGFRASMCNPYTWYDLQEEKITELILHPFCFMEANSFFEQHYDPSQTLEELRNFAGTIKAIGGTMTMIWHNTFLGKKEWLDCYRKFLEEFS
jgi:hypothetical protein